MMHRQRHHGSEAADEGHYWISISDLMTSLLFIFIIILAYTILTFSEKSAVFEESFYQRGELLTQIQTTLKSQNVDVDIDTKNGNMRIKSDGFFAVGAADLSPEGQAKMAVIAQVIQAKFAEKAAFKNAIDTVFIEGHTDNVPINQSAGGRRWTNMELSAQRAINTYTTMDAAAQIGQMKNRDGKYLYSYSGYADARSVADNASETGRAQNRRIEFFFALTSPQLNLKQ
ncbi:MAG: OmpA/MotB family protein [Formosimonas sp.]